MTGGSGFIGSKLIKSLCEQGHDVYNLDIKESHYENTIYHDVRKPIVNDSLENLNLIFHLAAQTSSIISQEDPFLDIDTNLYGALNVTELAYRNKCPIIFTSSMAVYSDEIIGMNTIPNPSSNYGVSKYASEFIIKRLEKYGLKYQILRLFNIYGPGQDMANLKQGMVSIFIQMALKFKKITVKGSKDRTRDFVYIDDLISYLLKSTENLNNLNNKIINIGTGISTSVEELLKTINLKLEENGIKQVPIEYSGGFPEDVNRIKLDQSLAIKNPISLDHGINLFIQELL